MTFCGAVTDGIWLAVDRDEASGRVSANRRHPRDRAASARAQRLALEAIGLPPEACAVSRSHTQGAGAALVARAPALLGVDLVQVDRVTPRHAASILSAREWDTLAPYAPIRPALAWALKEAAAKASGEPLRFFPGETVIQSRAGSLEVRLAGAAGTRLAVGWIGFGGLLCAWVVPVTTRRAMSPST